MKHYSLRHRRGMTLVDVVTALAICLFLTTMVFGGLREAREQANRIKCADNLRQIGQAALKYANDDRVGSFPRTYYDFQGVRGANKPNLILDTTGYGNPNSFGPGIGVYNVTASFYLILKTQDLSPSLFVCPSTKAVPGFAKGSKIGVKDSSNWEAIPGNMTYSYNCPFPSADAQSMGWKFNVALGAEHAMAADLNPGSDELLKLTPKSPKEQLKAGNSHNHQGDGQNVLYCDMHVEFQTTPFCGPPSYAEQPTAPVFRDNIYTFGGPSGTKGGDGVVGMPVTYSDDVLLPTGNADMPTTKPAGK